MPSASTLPKIGPLKPVVNDCSAPPATSNLARLALATPSTVVNAPPALAEESFRAVGAA